VTLGFPTLEPGSPNLDGRGAKGTLASLFNVVTRFEDSADQYRIKFTYDSKEAARSLLAGGGTGLLELGDRFRWGRVRGGYK